MKLKAVLTIAGTDCSGGAGVQADIKTMLANGVYAMSAITAMTAQNTSGVRSIMEASPEFLGDQLDMIFEDIFPDAVKIGMVPSPELMEVIADRLKRYGSENIVVDPVMTATSGSVLMKNSALRTLEDKLLPLAAIVTPNIPEAEMLAEMTITNADDMKIAAKLINSRFGCDVLIKGGHSISDANDLLCRGGLHKWFMGRRIDNPNTHGTGCTLSSAIASNLAKGHTMESAILNAKEYISGALSAMLELGKGSGPMHHGFDINSRFAEEAAT